MKLEKSTTIPRTLCQIDLLSLFVLFVLSDYVIVPQRIFQTSSYPCAYVSIIYGKTKSKFPREHPWSELGKQKIHITARRDGYITLLYTYWEILTKKLCHRFFIRKWVLANQRSERCFLTCEKNDTSNHKSQRCAWHSHQNSRLLYRRLQCSRFAWASQTFNKKRFFEEYFS